jgi:hypothetical protein
VALGDLPGDGEAEAGSAGLIGGAAVEPLEHPRAFIVGDAGPFVADRSPGPALGCRRNRQWHTTAAFLPALVS